MHPPIFSPDRIFPNYTARREKSPDCLAEKTVGSELLSRLEQGKVQGRLRTLQDFHGPIRPDLPLQRGVA